ncbi:MAG: SGNH/GDSL hydrolase family protein [Clostridia bacterium]|nr:SGNH/GDSL hydrolase family protein [Clostridia bacterium]
MDISKIDKNLKVETSLQESDIAFYDVRCAPFKLYGLYNAETEPQFKRLPDDVAKNTSEGVAYLALNTAGGRVRFATDSRYIAIKAEMPYLSHMPHCAMTGSSGFDLYMIDPMTDSSRFIKSFIPPVGGKDGFESIIYLPDNKMRYFHINFPTYSPVTNLYIGVQETATVAEGLKYRPLDPIVYYGSSITQGGCAMRPGNIYQEIVSRRMNMDYVDLGFSGNGKGEDVIVDYMANMKMSAFVSDYDHNAPNVEHLRNTHCKLYQKIREKNPDIPYIMLSKPDYLGNSNWLPENNARRDIIIDTFRYARAQGDKNVYFIDGESLFRGPYFNLCTVDGCHPTDVGFALMADAVEHELRVAFTQKCL